MAPYPACRERNWAGVGKNGVTLATTAPGAHRQIGSLFHKRID